MDPKQNEKLDSRKVVLIQNIVHWLCCRNEMVLDL